MGSLMQGSSPGLMSTCVMLQVRHFLSTGLDAQSIESNIVRLDRNPRHASGGALLSTHGNHTTAPMLRPFSALQALAYIFAHPPSGKPLHNTHNKTGQTGNAE